MKNNYFIKKSKTNIIFIMLLFYALFANTAAAQDTFTWNNAGSGDWATAANWDVVRGTIPGTDTFPGQTVGRVADNVVISNGGTPVVAANANAYGMLKLTISNLTGPESGSVLTINSGAAITVTSGVASMITLAGGSIINNGTLTSNSTANVASFGMNSVAPSVIPTVPRVYGYSGTGALNINRTVNSTNLNSGGIQFGGIAVNTTYKFSFDGTTTFTMPNTVALPGLYVFRMSQSSTIPVIISGSGFTINGNFGLIYQFGNGTSLTIDTGTTLTWNNSSATSPGYGIFLAQNFNGGGSLLNFVNKGNININGDTTQSGIFIAATSNCNCVSNLNFENQGAINVNIKSSAASSGALQIVGGTVSSRSNLNITNTVTGTMNLKNTQPLDANIGRAFQITLSPASPSVNFTNNGILNFTGSNTNFGGQLETILNNNGTISLNYGFDNMLVNNNASGTINYTDAATTFTVDASVAATAGATYEDANTNVYTVTTTKAFGSGTKLLTTLTTANKQSVSAAPEILTLTSGAGDGSINYSIINAGTIALMASAELNNTGTLNTGKGSGASLNGFPGTLTLNASGVFNPGGASKGVVNFNNANTITLVGTLKFQVAGNTKAGVDFDQITNNSGGSYEIDGAAILDVTGIYNPTEVTTINIITTTTGTITGTFSTVIGLTAGWSVDYSATGKVRLMYDPALGTNQFSKFKFSVYPNPATDVLNLSVDKNINKVELFNLLGQKVQSNTVNAAQKQFDISNLQKGIYLMEVTIENTKETYKIIKK